MVVARSRHAELVSASILPQATSVLGDKWTPKQVQGDDLPTGTKRQQAQPNRQIMPIGVLALDQIDLPLPMPAFQLLLAGNGAFHVAEQFVAHEAVDLVATGEAFDGFIAMMPQSANQVAGDAYVKRPMSLTGEDVNAGLALWSHAAENAAKWMLKQVQHDESL